MTDREELIREIARELYDRFVMGGWEPQDAYPQIEGWLEIEREAGRVAGREQIEKILSVPFKNVDELRATLRQELGPLPLSGQKGSAK